MLHQIGAGRLGPVFRAWQADRERLVAIKVFQLDLVPEQVSALAGELQKLVGLRLRHAAIAAPMAAGMQGGAAYLAQEFCTGESLDVAMRQSGPWAPARALRLIGSIGSAIDLAAARGAHHGALHPRDVLLSAGDLRVTGFGVLQTLERVGLRVLGRHPYGAPELAAGQHAGIPTDVYALAVIAYELLAGKRVSGIADQGLDQLAAAQNADRPALRQVFATALAPDPAARYQTARALATALESALSGGSPRLPLLDGGDATEPEVDGGAGVDDEIDVMDLSLRDDEDRPGPERAAIVAFPGVIAIDPPVAQEAEEEVRTGPTEIDLPEPAAVASTPSAGPSIDEPTAASDRRPAERARERSGASDEARAQRSEPGSGAEPRLIIAYTAMWPLVLALGVGLLVGFALGYGMAMRDTGGAALAQAPAPVRAPMAAPAPVAQPPASALAQTAASGISERSLPAAAANAPAAASAPPVQHTPVAPTLPVDGRLVIRSTPAGAHVLLNGRARGVTPLSLSGLPFATYRLRLELSGYQADERRVALDAGGATRQVTATLRPVPRPATGIIVVESLPAGAQVFLDGHLLGVTPLTLPAVAAGEHRIRLQRPGFQPWATTVQVAGGERNRVTASLEEGPQQ